MATKNDFSSTDWNTLRETPSLVGFAMLQAGSSGLGTVKELFAFSQAIMENQASDVPLIRDLTGHRRNAGGTDLTKAVVRRGAGKAFAREFAATRSRAGPIL